MNIKIAKVEKEDKKWRADVGSLYENCDFIEKTAEYFHAYFAAYLGKELVGHSIIFNTGDKWLLDGLYVKPEYRGRGIAGELIEARIKFARENGASELWFNCGDSNIASVKSHEHCNFEKVHPATREEAPEPSYWYKLSVSGQK